MTIHGVRRLIDKEARQAGSLRALGRHWGITAGHLSRVLRGEKEPGEAVLRHLGLTACTLYVPTRNESLRPRKGAKRYSEER